VTLEPGAATAADFSGGQDPAQPALWAVQIGDYIEFNGGGLPHQITAVTATTLTLASPLLLDVPLTGNYRIIRTPRLAGDESQKLPDSVIIDLSTDTLNTLPRDPLTGTIDILFAPSGAVIGRGTASESIYMWVRDEGLPLYEGDNTIVVVYSRSGALAAH